MKSVTLKLEAIGLYQKLCMPGASPGRARTGKAPWVAEIVSFHDKYLFQREFLKGLCDWTESNSVGSRGVMYIYHCFSGPIYETWHKETWKREKRYFFRIIENRIHEMEEIEVIKCLSCI